MKNIILFIVLLSYFAKSLKVISSFKEFEEASQANPIGRLVSEKPTNGNDDISVCLRFMAFFEHKTTLGTIHINVASLHIILHLKKLN